MATLCGRLLSTGSDLFDWPLSVVDGDLPPITSSLFLRNSNPGDIDELHAVYLGQGRLLPIRIRVFLEFLTQHIKIGETPYSRDA